MSSGRQLAGLREMVVMMFGYGYGHGGGWPVWATSLMWVGMLAVAALLIWALARSSFWRSGTGSGEDRGDPGRILDERLARGEIDADDYARLREVLDSGGTGRPAGTGSRR